MSCSSCRAWSSGIYVGPFVPADQLVQGGPGFNGQGIAGKVRDLQPDSFGDVALPVVIRQGRAAVDQVDADVVESLVLCETNGLRGLGGIMGAVHPPEVIVKEDWIPMLRRLIPADRQALIFPVRHVVRVGFEGDLRVGFEGKVPAQPVEDPVQLRRVEQGRSAAAEIDGSCRGGA